MNNIVDPIIKFCHIGKTSNGIEHNGIITLATRLDGSIISYGASFCSNKDRFNKKIGRNISIGRLETIPAEVQLEENEISHKQIVLAILEDILVNQDYPYDSEYVLLNAIDWYNTESAETSTYTLTINDKSITWTMPNMTPSKILKVSVLDALSSLSNDSDEYYEH